MRILLTLDNSKLAVLNNSMQALDSLTIQSQPKRLKSLFSICVDLRTELLQKGVKNRQKDKSFIMKLSYYKADALLNFLKEYEVYFPDTFGTYETNACLQITNELHKQLI